jgi:hypothetical protein
MNKIILSIFLTLVSVVQIAAADDATQPEYLDGPITCRLVEVSIQYEPGSSGSRFHCLVASADPDRADGIMYELENLPPELEQAYEREFSSGSGELEIRRLYRSPTRLTFTEDTTWSITRLQ